ncbi:Rossmann-fold NAD(P)-binding domain-containing protein [Roseateles koreensis]|uniref:2-octaprenyl-6-methoxyphenyl hydroxylase n=1 Tax=Roseateles koreensis TaxID=2987526 RepID=A0ABT5KXV7_9BURK|nr:2-octaprenyl-6-methoxyphenyl hydroxylase [Roseateles koreensis]MDC8787220.1 2-octaprenyl-6-methoxyphenyl hydroxylase [Roseateles koreensis]
MFSLHDSSATTADDLYLAIVGAGPAGLTLALLAAQWLPKAHISLFDARPLSHDVSGDPRTLALSLGSVQLLRRLRVWDDAQAQAILQVHVSQAPPTLSHPVFGPGMEPQVHISAAEQGVSQLGAVLSYGQLVAPLQAAWQARVAQEPARLSHRFGTPVKAVKPVDQGTRVEVDAEIAEVFDLAVIAEGGVFADQARKAIAHDYAQNAWVGTVSLSADSPASTAYERFTRNGPLALLPLRPVQIQGQPAQRRAALVWCVPQAEDDIANLSDAQRLAVLQSLLPATVGPLQGISPLKCFALGLNAERTLVEACTVRIGNAAQTLHPVAGQGLNLGLRDAFALVEALRRTVQAAAEGAGQTAKADLIQKALKQVEWSRAPDRWSMIAATDFLARSFAWRWPGLPAARGLALAALQALPPLKRALAQGMMFGRR